jgi:N6-adenosine-specific RNA methylase IME4
MVNGKRYSVVLCDPPWKYSDKSLHRGGAERHYKTMTVKQISRLNVQGIAARDCVLFLWVTDPFIARGVHIYIAERWGFTVKSKAFTWVKTSAQYEKPSGDNLDEGKRLAWGMGHWTRANPEVCWTCVRGHPKRVDAGVHSVIMAPRREHSAKPPETRDRIVRLCGDVPRIELFARGKVPQGWDSWGDEAE